MSKKPEITTCPASWRRVFHYLFSKSPLGDLGVNISQVCLTLVLLVFFTSLKARSQDPGNSDRTIKIGLLIQDSSYTSVVQGAELAVSNANRKGGLNGRRFQLEVRSMEGPWGTGSKQAVDLIFEEKVWALLGAHDGRNAHLVEQAATKSQVVFVSAWSGDPTLSQAFVPWFFNCVPNDRQQAGSLIEEIYNKRKINQVAVIYGNDYDSKMALDNFLRQAKMSGKPDPVLFCCDDFDLKTGDLVKKIEEAKVRSIILFCQAKVATDIVHQIRLKKLDLPLFGHLMLLIDNELSESELQVFNDLLSVPSGNWLVPEVQAFRKEYQENYKKMPGITAYYSFDAANTLIEAMKNAGTNDREKIQKALATMNFKGITGSVKFDDKGNRSGNFKTRQVKNGLPVIIK
jgi:branched-chain amino acid transport system substrate-binding protein